MQPSPKMCFHHPSEGGRGVYNVGVEVESVVCEYVVSVWCGGTVCEVWVVQCVEDVGEGAVCGDVLEVMQ